MKILLGNFAGTHSNLGKILTWNLIKKKEDCVFMIYWNKGRFNDDPNVWPITHYPEEADKNFFYRYFEFPENQTKEDFLHCDALYLNYPCFLEESQKKLWPLELYPLIFQKYNGFVFTTKALLDPEFQQIRNIYHDLWKTHLKPTQHLLDLMKEDRMKVESYTKKGKVLCVMIRFAGHFSTPFDSNALFDEIKEMMNSFDFILPITQQFFVYETLCEMYGEKCISLDRRRIPNNVDWCSLMYTDEAFEEEFHIAVKDSYLASMCHTIMGGSSGLFYSALFINPNANMVVFDALKDKDAF